MYPISRFGDANLRIRIVSLCLGWKYCISTLYLNKFKYKILVIFVSILRNRVHGSIKIVNRLKNREWSDECVSCLITYQVNKSPNLQLKHTILFHFLAALHSFDDNNHAWSKLRVDGTFKLSENLDVKGTFSATKRILMKSKKSINFWLAVLV